MRTGMFSKGLAVAVIILFLGLAISPSINAGIFNKAGRGISSGIQNSDEENYNCTVVVFAKQTFMRCPDEAYPIILKFGEWLVNHSEQDFPPLILVSILYLFFTKAYVFFGAFVNPFLRWPLTITFGMWIDRPSFPLPNKSGQFKSNMWSLKFPARGYVWTNGTNGIVEWKGFFWGDLGIIKTGNTKDYIGIEGFKGFKFSRLRNAYDVYIGKADHVKMTYKWPGWI